MDRTLLEIKEAEEEAEHIITRAEKKTHEFLLTLQTTIAHEQDVRQEAFEKEKKNALDHLRKALEKKRSAILKDSETEAQVLTAKAHKNLPASVDFVVTAFKDYIKQ
ncbi:hypothetical protein HYY69_07080 [Candidatus Woesearchaeota archaeon]|nr:hypothetical protein [Candidatus Woesearchaeota archaeon]